MHYSASIYGAGSLDSACTNPSLECYYCPQIFRCCNGHLLLVLLTTAGFAWHSSSGCRDWWSAMPSAVRRYPLLTELPNHFRRGEAQAMLPKLFTYVFAIHWLTSKFNGLGILKTRFNSCKILAWACPAFCLHSAYLEGTGSRPHR